MPKIRYKETYYLEAENFRIPLQVHFEIRSSIRISIGKRSAHLRLPATLRPHRAQQEIRKAKDWIQEKVRQNPKIATQYLTKEYLSGDLLQVGRRTYTLVINYKSVKNISGKLKGDQILLTLAPNVERTSIKQLLSRIVAKDYHPLIKQRVAYFNDQYFNQKIKGIKLKYNQGNWGSCSSSGNINLSTRLLFAPDEVIDYVIVHELAHLIEMNHSSSFYLLIKSVIPNYEIQEKWLKEHGYSCDF
jgi:predicted metal-dependent hydrolase